MPPPSGGPVDHSARQHRAPQVLDGLNALSSAEASVALLLRIAGKRRRNSQFALLKIQLKSRLQRDITWLAVYGQQLCGTILVFLELTRRRIRASRYNNAKSLAQIRIREFLVGNLDWQNLIEITRCVTVCGALEIAHQVYRIECILTAQGDCLLD